MFFKTCIIIFDLLLTGGQRISISGFLAILSEKKIHSLHWGIVYFLEIMKSEINNNWLKLRLLEYMTEYTRTKFQTHWRFFYIIVLLKSNIISQLFFLVHLTIRKIYIICSVMSVKMCEWSKLVSNVYRSKISIDPNFYPWKCIILMKVKFSVFNLSVKSAVFHFLASLILPRIIWSVFCHCEVKIEHYYLHESSMCFKYVVSNICL